MRAKVTVLGHGLDEVKAALKYADVTSYISFDATDDTVTVTLSTQAREATQSHAIEAVNALRHWGIAASWEFDDDGS